jgi:hypothetical protein
VCQLEFGKSLENLVDALFTIQSGIVHERAIKFKPCCRVPFVSADEKDFAHHSSLLDIKVSYKV